MLSFDDANGNLFNRIGRLGKVIAQLRTYQDAQDFNMTDLNAGVVGELEAEPDIQAIMGSAYLGILAAAGGNVGGTMQQLAVQILNRMIFRDAPRLNQTLTSDNTLSSMQELIRQMTAAGASVLAPTVAATPSAFQGVGNAVLNVSVRRPFDARVLENTFAETMNAICTADSYTGGATVGNETVRVTGTGSQGDVFAFDWPLGSDAVSAISLINGGADQSQGNLLVNSSFDDWTGNVPDDWEVTNGTAGVNIFEAAGAGYDSDAALQFTGDGTSLIGVRQLISSSLLDVLAQYGACVFARRGGTAISTGTLRVALTDSTNTVLTDAGGLPCSYTVDLTGVTTAWRGYTGAFRTPRSLPDEVYLGLYVSGPQTSGTLLYMDRVSTGLMTQTYLGGPFVCGHSANVPLVLNDAATIAVTNSRGAAGTLNTFQTLFWRLFTVMGSNDLLLPSSPVPTLSDNLITS